MKSSQTGQRIVIVILLLPLLLISEAGVFFVIVKLTSFYFHYCDQFMQQFYLTLWRWYINNMPELFLQLFFTVLNFEFISQSEINTRNCFFFINLLPSLFYELSMVLMLTFIPTGLTNVSFHLPWIINRRFVKYIFKTFITNNKKKIKLVTNVSGTTRFHLGTIKVSIVLWKIKICNFPFYYVFWIKH